MGGITSTILQNSTPRNLAALISPRLLIDHLVCDSSCFMSVLNPATLRRLKQLPQDPSVWEGDRLSLTPMMQSGLHKGLSLAKSTPQPEETEDDYVLWVDGSHGVVRSMETVPAESGPEVMIRTLIQAIEYPHSPARPARPKKIVVRDREIQFYLQSILQDLDITLEFVPELPLISELMESFQNYQSNRPPDIPPQFGDLLLEKAEQVWKLGPWRQLCDHQIIAIELNQWDIEHVYLSLLGNLGMEFGVLAYRNLDSLKTFRVRALEQSDITAMQEAFMAQDCLFLNYETELQNSPFGQSPMASMMATFLSYDQVEPSFGSLHPLEGMRSFLHEEETIALSVILEGLCRFMTDHKTSLSTTKFPALSSEYEIPLPPADGFPESIAIKVQTLPDLANEFLALQRDEDDSDDGEIFQDTLIPENALVSMRSITWEMLETWRSQVKHHQPSRQKQVGKELPMLLVQTSAPKAKVMIQQIEDCLVLVHLRTTR